MKYLLFSLRTSAITGDNSSKWSGYHKKLGVIKKLSDKEYQSFVEVSNGKDYWSHRFPDGWFIGFNLTVLPDRQEAAKVNKTLDSICGYDDSVDEIVSTGEIKNSLA